MHLKTAIIFASSLITPILSQTNWELELYHNAGRHALPCAEQNSFLNISGTNDRRCRPIINELYAITSAQMLVDGDPDGCGIFLYTTTNCRKNSLLTELTTGMNVSSPFYNG